MCEETVSYLNNILSRFAHVMAVWHARGVNYNWRVRWCLGMIIINTMKWRDIVIVGLTLIWIIIYANVWRMYILRKHYRALRFMGWWDGLTGLIVSGNFVWLFTGRKNVFVWSFGDNRTGVSLISLMFGIGYASLIVLLSQRESFVTVKIFESKILINYDVFEHPESE